MREETRAHTALIAAAPDLYAACEASLVVWDIIGHLLSDDVTVALPAGVVIEETVARMEAALRKARGDA